MSADPLPMRTGTLEMLVFMPMDGAALDYALALSWLDFPPSATWGGPYVYDVDFGDSESTSFSTLPDSPGLWLLRWDWKETSDEDECEDCWYAEVCSWTRPTTEDIGRLTTAHPDFKRTHTPTSEVADA